MCGRGAGPRAGSLVELLVKHQKATPLVLSCFFVNDLLKYVPEVQKYQAK